MSLGRKFKLNSGYEIPAIGLGTWVSPIQRRRCWTETGARILIQLQLSKPHEVEDAVAHALRVGYRHIDTAAVYQNEAEVGAGWKKSGVPREEIFVSYSLASLLYSICMARTLS